MIDESLDKWVNRHTDGWWWGIYRSLDPLGLSDLRMWLIWGHKPGSKSWRRAQIMHFSSKAQISSWSQVPLTPQPVSNETQSTTLKRIKITPQTWQHVCVCMWSYVSKTLFIQSTTPNNPGLCSSLTPNRWVNESQEPNTRSLKLLVVFKNAMTST